MGSSNDPDFLDLEASELHRYWEELSRKMKDVLDVMKRLSEILMKKKKTKTEVDEAGKNEIDYLKKKFRVLKMEYDKTEDCIDAILQASSQDVTVSAESEEETRKSKKQDDVKKNVSGKTGFSHDFDQEDEDSSHIEYLERGIKGLKTRGGRKNKKAKSRKKGRRKLY